MSKNGHEPEAQRVRLLRDGSGQVVHIPRELELDTAEATVRREGNRIIIEAAGPVERRSTLAELLDKWAKEPPLKPEDDFDFEGLDDFPTPAMRT